MGLLTMWPRPSTRRCLASSAARPATSGSRFKRFQGRLLRLRLRVTCHPSSFGAVLRRVGEVRVEELALSFASASHGSVSLGHGRIIRTAMEPVKYAYWSVRCRTENCGVPILLKPLGVYDPNQPPPVLESSENFPAYCGACQQRHTYSRDDVQRFIAYSAS